MQMRTWATLAMVWSAVATNACSRSDTAAGTVGATAADTADAGSVAASARLASVGHEILSDSVWRAMLDTIRTRQGDDRAAAARASRSFAVTARHQAAAANEVAGAALARSADELDTLADNFEIGADPDPERVDRSIARLEHAESLDHLAKAMDAWGSGRRIPASAELESAVNEFELAANDSRSTLDEQAIAAIADARWAVTRLAGDVEVPTDELLRTVTALDEAVRSLGRHIAR